MRHYSAAFSPRVNALVPLFALSSISTWDRRSGMAISPRVISQMKVSAGAGKLKAARGKLFGKFIILGC